METNKVIIVLKRGKILEYSNTHLSIVINKLSSTSIYTLSDVLSITVVEIKD